MVTRWIGYIIQSNVREFSLYIDASVYDDSKRYNLPQSVLTAKSITELKLRDCKLGASFSHLSLPSLK
ncbi:hypothetical protein CJ030_MR5G025399 [Morella rubra]|uniref:Uncharacterized protein n=1 Tax=Morella rubra TaxID=262757 RepID=A0A6A1VH69_9ROSI|nr:hypothetical protein CJ030_MR5G025399 [Morella rubra]